MTDKPDFTAMTGPELLAACGTDATKWAAAFMRHVERHGSGYVKEGMMIGWFANAIMHTHDTLTGNGPVVLPDGSAVVIGNV